jgi:UDP-glucose 4-epimerase
LTDKQTVLVTGASGFMAQHIIPQLKNADYQVVGIDNRSIENPLCPIIQADITDLQVLTSLTPTDYIIHLAAIAAPNQCKNNPKLAYDVNVLGTNNVLKMGTVFQTKKVIFLSSAHVYGISPKYMPTPEEAPLQLTDTYTTTKILGEKLCQLYYENYSLPYLTFRLFNAYGSHQTTDYFIPSMITKAKNGEINLTGTEITKDWVYIPDVIDAILRGLKTDYVGALNIGTGIQTSLGTIAEKIANEFGAKFSSTPQQPAPTYMEADISKTRAILGWTPPTNFETGLRLTLDWYKSN